MNTNLFVKALVRAERFASKEENRPEICAINVRNVGQSLCMTATDGVRLIKIDVPGEWPVLDKPRNIHRRFVSLIARWAAECPDGVMSFEDDGLHLDDLPVIVWESERFPDTNLVTPKIADCDHFTEVDMAAHRKYARSLAWDWSLRDRLTWFGATGRKPRVGINLPMWSPQSPHVILGYGQDATVGLEKSALWVWSQTRVQGDDGVPQLEWTQSLPHPPKDALIVAVNWKFLSESANGDAQVTAFWTDSLSCVRIDRELPDWHETHVIMPVRI